MSLHSQQRATKKEIQILIADEQQIMVEGLCSLIQSQAGLSIAGIASDGITAVKMARKLQPDIVITGVGLPKMNGIAATREILDNSETPKIIALSTHSEKRFVEKMIQAGASGYILKGCGFDELIHGINVVLMGQTYLCKEIRGIIIESYFSLLKKNNGSGNHHLTAREKEVLQLIAEGYSTQKTAESLHISKKTVETHRRRIMSKLGVKTIAGLTKYAIKEGITTL